VPPFTSILVDIDASAGVHPALDRAIALARHWGARLLVGRPAIALIQDVLRSGHDC
jgi:nucleotide-binding universal stress UspA family protein